jgi:WD40 repeat protein/tetratricopeptide (TPR) repeat protein
MAADRDTGCFLAFLRGEYAACELLARAAIQEGRVQLWTPHLLVVSVRRQDRYDEAVEIGGQLADKLKKQPWAQLMLKLSIGKADLADALAQAASEEQRCQASYYGGAFLLAEGKVAQARDTWTECRRSQALIDEKTLAEIEQARVSESLPCEPKPREEARLRAEESAVIDAFVAGDWPSCERAATVLIKRGPFSALVGHALLVSVRRQGRAQEANDRAEALIGELEAGSFDHTALGVSTGSVPAGHVLGQADTEDQRCQALYYAGALLSAQGSYDAAVTQFEACRDAPGQPAEKRLAEIEMARARESLASREVQKHLADQRAALQLGESTLALQIAQRALETAQRVPGRRDLVAASLTAIGETQLAVGNPPEAERAMKEAVEVWRAAEGELGAGFLHALVVHGDLALTMGRPAQAEPMFRKVVESAASAPRIDPEDAASALSGLGTALSRIGRLDEAETILRQAIDGYRVRGRDRDLSITRPLHALGTLLVQAARPVEAEIVLRDVLEVRRERLGDDHADTAETAALLASTTAAKAAMSQRPRPSMQAMQPVTPPPPSKTPTVPPRATSRSGEMRAVQQGSFTPAPGATATKASASVPPPPLPAAPATPIPAAVPAASMPRECQGFLQTKRTRLLRTLGGYTFKSAETIELVVCPPDERGVFTLDAVGRVVLWDALNGLPLRSFSLDEEVPEKPSAVRPTAAELSRDGKRIAIGRYNGALALYDAVRGTPIWTTFATGLGSNGKPPKSAPPVQAVTISPDDEILASYSETEELVRIWEAKSGARLGELAGKVPVAFSPDGNLLWAGETLYDARSWDELATAKGPDGARLRSAAFSPDSRWVFFGCSKGYVMLWSTQAKMPAWTGKVKDPSVGHVGWGRDGHPYSVAMGMSTWELATGRQLKTGAFSATASVALARERGRLFGASRGSRILRQLEVEWGVELDSDGHADLVRTVEVAPDGQTAITASPDSTVRIWHLGTGAILKTFTWAKFRYAAFLPDGKRALTVSEQGLRIYDVQTGNVVGEIKRFGERDVTGVAISPDGARVVLCTDDGHANLVDVVSSEVVWRERIGAHFPWFSRSGERVMLVTTAAEIRVLDPSTGRLIERCPVPDKSEIPQPHKFLRDGQRVLSVITGEGLALRDLKSGQIHCMMPDPANATRLLALSYDERIAITNTEHGGLGIWNINEAQLLDVIDVRSSGDRVECAALTPDGRMLLAGTARGVVLSFEVTGTGA